MRRRATRVPGGSAGANPRWTLPLVILWSRDGLLLIGLTVALLSLDDPFGLTRLWWVLPLALASVALTLATPSGRPFRPRHVVALALLAMIPTARAWFSLGGPLPPQGLSETMDLAAILMLAVALWRMASGAGRRAVGLWTAAVLLAWAIECILAYWPSGSVGGTPAGRVMLGVSGLAGLMVLLFDRGFRGRGRRRRPARRWVLPARLAALAAGLMAGWLLANLPSLLGNASTALASGRRALPLLWLQSLLLGWGMHATGPMARMLAQPHDAVLRSWSGPWAVLAMGGLLGIGLLAAICILLLWRRPRRAGGARSDVPTGAFATALALLGLTLAGGPLSAVALASLAGWTALALASPGRPQEWPVRWTASPMLATGVFGLAATGLTLLLALPVHGDSLLHQSKNPHLPLARREQILARAEQFNPFDPAIPLALASVERDRMTATQVWSESLYQAVLANYRRAQRLDPFSVAIPMNVGQFQLVCKRESEAIKTVQQALARQPHSEELAEWLFKLSMRLSDSRKAYQMLDRGLKMQPMQPLWWVRQYTLSNSRGQTTLARRSLNIALTAQPDQPYVAQQAWHAEAGGGQPAQPGVSLPPRPVATQGI